MSLSCVEAIPGSEQVYSACYAVLADRTADMDNASLSRHQTSPFPRSLNEGRFRSLDRWEDMGGGLGLAG